MLASDFLIVFTAGALLLASDYTEVELIYSRDEYRDGRAALLRKLLREALECDFRIKIDGDESTAVAELVEQFSHLELASATTAPDSTCHRGICLCYKTVSTCPVYSVL